MPLLDQISDMQYRSSVENIRNIPDTSRFRALSLIYRLLGDINKEREVIIEALDKDIDSRYFSERKDWHNLPRHQKMVAREPLLLPKERDWKPRRETVDQLCFVTIGGGKRPFRDMVECLESLRNTPSYRDHPVYVVDTGLSDYQRSFLKARVNVLEFFDPSDLFPKWPQKQQSWLSIAYLSTFFPHSRYFFHLECDTWIQDERSIDKYLVLCEKQGWAMDGWNVGIYCMDKHSGFAEQWIEVTSENSLIMERSANQVYRRNQLQFLKDVDGSACPDFMYRHAKPAAPIGLRNNSMVWHTGIPFLDEENIFIDSITMKPVGIFHCHKPCEYIRNLNYKVLTRTLQKPIAEKIWKKHLEYSRKQLANGPDNTHFEEGYDQIASMRFRTFPWKCNHSLHNQLLDIVREHN